MHQLAGFVGLSFYAKQTAVGRLALTYWISHAKWSTISSSSSSGSSSKVILEPHLCTYVRHFRAPDHELYGVSHVTGAMRSDHSEHNLQRELQLGSNVFAADFWQIYECLIHGTLIGISLQVYRKRSFLVQRKASGTLRLLVSTSRC